MSRARAIVDAAAQDLEEYSEAMTDTLAQYRIHSRAMLQNFRAAYESARELWSDDTRKENRQALTGLVSAMESTLHSTAEFQATLRRLPALTGRFKRARNQAATMLGELIAEITFSNQEAKQLALDLGNGGTVAA